MKLRSKHLLDTLLKAVPERLRTRAVRKWGTVLLAIIVVYGVVGFLVVPPLIRHFSTPVLSRSLSRPVSIGSISLNPFTLRFEADQVQVHQRRGTGDFVAINKLVVRFSWSSLFRLKPIIDEVWLDAPSVNITRTAPHQFNFTDLLQRYSKPAKASGKKPTRFSVSNIHIDDGSINFDDRVLNRQHHINHIRIGIPFIANLPSTTDIFVKPLLQARIDGSPLLIIGNTKPYSSSRESDVTLKLNHLNLPQLMSYVPASLPIRVSRGQLSSNLDLQFQIVNGTPRIIASGAVVLDGISITDKKGRALFNAHRLRVVASSVEPLLRIFHLSSLELDRPVLYVSRGHDGVLNLSALAHSNEAKPHKAAPTAGAKPSVKTISKTAPARPLDFKLQHLILKSGAIHLQDKKTATPVEIDLAGLDADVTDFNTLGKHPTAYSVQARLLQGSKTRGQLSGKGTLVYAEHKGVADITVKALSLPTLQAYLDSVLAGRIESGDLNANSKLLINWSKSHSALQANDTAISLSDLSVSSATSQLPVIKLAQADARIQRVDLSSHSAEIPSINLQGLDVTVQRDRNGAINLAVLVKQGKPGEKKSSTLGIKKQTNASQAAAWRYHIGTLALSKSAIDITDQTHAKPVVIRVSALQFKLNNISQNMHEPWPFDLSGTLQDHGSVALAGSVTLDPLALKIRVRTRHLNVAAFEPYYGGQINASVASALLYVNGNASLAKTSKGWKVNYDGDAGLGNVRMLDKSTSDLFAGWRRLHLSHIRAVYDANGPDVSIGQIVLNHFFARIYLDSSGKLNLSHFFASKNATPRSLTRVEQGAVTSKQSIQKQPTTETARTSPMNLRFGEVILDHGSINYTDHFIKPNYSAKLIDIQGRIGAFGTRSTQPAPVQFKADLSTGGSVVIGGKVNPLTQPPFLDMTAQASDIELPQFASYSSKYTGYPIEKGKLKVDLNYHLDHGQLTATNHLFIDQLTFGDHVESPTALNLPIRFAVSLLKNSQGQINLNIPVSGSLSDPKFSIGGLIWQAFTGLIRKAITAPFALLSSAFGGSEKLSYIEFEPGSAVLTDKAVGKLDILKKALSDRPAIELDISGYTDPAKDRPALRAMQVDWQVKAAKLKALRARGEQVKAANVTVSSDEYDEYLKLAYEAADIKKPRNFIGFAKSIPPDQMKQLILDNAKVSDDDLNALARRRVAAVLTWFKGKIDDKRIFVVAPKAQTSKPGDTGPRVEFSLKH